MWIITSVNTDADARYSHGLAFVVLYEAPPPPPRTHTHIWRLIEFDIDYM